MNKLLLALLFALSLSKVFGQTTWCPPGAQWHYGYGSWGTLGYVDITFVNDTIVDGINCKHLNEFVSYYEAINSSFGQFNQPRFTYEDSGVVYGYDGGWDTLINFNAIPGDKWGMQYDANYSDAVVQDTGHKIINGFDLKWLTVEYSNATGIVDTIFERIGYAGQVYPFWMHGLAIDQDYWGFCNYSDSAFNDYRNIDSVCTLLPTGINNLSQNSISIFPNPTNDLVEIQNLPNNENEIMVSNASGQVLFRKLINNKNDTSGNLSAGLVDLSPLANGFYIITITSHQFVYKGKIIKSD